MKTSLVLCTKNGGDRLGECLRRIEAMETPADLQLVLVDNGSTDGSSYQRLQDFGNASRHDSLVLQTYTPGNSAGRNLGLRHVTGDLILFIDDDCYVEPTFASDWIDLFSTRDIGFGSGMIKRYSEVHSDLGCNESPDEEFVAAGAWVRRGLIQGSNMAFRRECLNDAGPFDSRFGAGTRYAGEEWDVALRANLAGWSGGYFPRPTVWHDHRRGGDTARERLLYYDFGAGAVYARTLFGKKGTRVLPALRGEFVYLLRHDRPRLTGLAAGFLDYALTRRRMPSST